MYAILYHWQACTVTKCTGAYDKRSPCSKGTQNIRFRSYRYEGYCEWSHRVSRWMDIAEFTFPECGSQHVYGRWFEVFTVSFVKFIVRSLAGFYFSLDVTKLHKLEPTVKPVLYIGNWIF